MSNVIEKTVSDYIADKKKEDDAVDGKPELDFPSDTISVARSVDDDLSELKGTYGILKDRLRKDSSLAGKIKDLVENEVRHIIKPS